MFRKLLLVLLTITAATASTQMIVLHGKVTNKKNKPIAGAILTVVNNSAVDTTDARGMYSFSVPLSEHPVQTLHGERAIALHEGTLSIGLNNQVPVTIEMFNTKGILLERAEKKSLSSGRYRFPILAHHFAAHLMMLRISIGNDVSLIRYMPLGGNNRAIASFLSLPAIKPAIDSLRVAAKGYLRKTSPVSSYKDTVNFTLDTLSLAKFSFFVTSLKALRELSKNSMGFGGDLRFGKTGPGAGLLGADSICQCIAERSMPGSKIKVWRAFLSVVSGPDGKQINAIDRIGQGPWYDRRGRTVALTIDDLRNDRPLNSDAAIQEDLPNEDGVPNHQPDPNLPAVDNHLTITGSDGTGRLYISVLNVNPTCEDWTTASAATDSKPRCGVSWVRKGYPMNALGSGSGGMFINMKSWISAWSLPGCVAGIDSTDSSGPGDPTSKAIGAGGGYGGFYCFAQNP